MHLAVLGAVAVVLDAGALAAGEALGLADVRAVGVAEARPMELVALRLAIPRQSHLHGSPLLLCTTKINKACRSVIISCNFSSST